MDKVQIYYLATLLFTLFTLISRSWKATTEKEFYLSIATLSLTVLFSVPIAGRLFLFW